MSDCIFCKITKKEAEASILEESENAIAFKSISPAAEQHVLIVPKKHVETFTSLGEEDKDLFYEMAEMAQAVVKTLGIGEGYKLIFNGGKYQYIKHLHWHLLGGELEEDYHEKV